MELHTSSGRSLITLMSDFGWSSQGVGHMKVVILEICPNARLVDITHEIAPFSTVDGASELETLAYLPPGGIHVCAVDPGVGSRRKVIALRTRRSDVLIGPDNGVLVPAAIALGGIVNAVSVENPRYMWNVEHATFHGRDVMAPAAAHLGAGIPLDSLGPDIPPDELAPAAFGEAAEGLNGAIECSVIHVNRYGTAYLNIKNAYASTCGLLSRRACNMRIGEDSTIVVPVGKTFSDVAEGDPILFPGHFGRMQVAANLGSFCERFRVRLGSTLIIT
jgi:S-adenosylmethionine hydrolase